jgi:hypothetical protein
VTTSGNSPGNAADGITEVEQRKLNDIQQALRKSGFVIAKALKTNSYSNPVRPRRGACVTTYDLTTACHIAKSIIVLYRGAVACFLHDAQSPIALV